MLHSLKKMFKSNYLFTFGVIICLFWIIMAIIAGCPGSDPEIKSAFSGAYLWYR